MAKFLQALTCKLLLSFVDFGIDTRHINFYWLHNKKATQFVTALFNLCLKHGIKNRSSVLNKVGKSAIFVLNRVRVWGAGPHLPTKRYIEYLPRAEHSRSLPRIASSRRSVSSGSAGKTSRKKIKKRAFLRSALTNWTPGRSLNFSRLLLSLSYGRLTKRRRRLKFRLAWKRLCRGRLSFNRCVI